MESEKEPPKEDKPDLAQSKARENIKTLTSISQELPTLLTSAGSAIALLSTNPAVPNAATATLEQRQTSFAQHVKEYYANLNAIQTALLRQVDLLEEARILPAEQQQQQEQSSDAAAAVGDGSTGTGMGKFDVAWLNARSRDVGREKERELVEDARAYLAQMEGRNGTRAETKVEHDDDDDAMEE